MRSFIAIELSGDLRDKIFELQNKLKENIQGKIKWVEKENFHLTMKFLGDIKQKKVDELIKNLICPISKIEQFDMELKTIGFFPNEHYAKVMWLGAFEKGENLVDISSIIEEAAGRLDIEKSNKEFHAHVTLGRVKSKLDLKSFGTLGKTEIGSYKVNKVSIIESKLTPKGPVYKTYKEINLK